MNNNVKISQGPFINRQQVNKQNVQIALPAAKDSPRIQHPLTALPLPTANPALL